MGKGGGCGCSIFSKDAPQGLLTESEPKAEVAEVHPPGPQPVVSLPTELQVTPPPASQPQPPVSHPPAQEVTESIVAPPVHEPPTVHREFQSEKVEDASVVKVFIVFYSMYGHTLQLAIKVKEGVDSVDGAKGYLFQVPETLSASVLEKMMAPPKPTDIPVIEVPQLTEADAIIFGFPTRFGMMCAQMKHFMDATGSLWKNQALAGKPSGFFFSTGTQGGGQETTAMTAISQLVHHGMLYVPVGYTFQGLFHPDVHGGSPYGAGTYAGDGTRSPLELELDLAAHQGKIIGLVATKMKKGGD